MKTLLLALSFLLFAFATKADVVLDADGDPLLPGAQYYIYPLPFGPFIGGGIRPGQASNSIYRTSVLNSFSKEDYGEPLKFQPLQRIGIIKTESNLSIEFVHTPNGVSSGKWIAVKDLGGTIWTVGIGGAEDHKGYETLNGYFEIKKSIEGGYQISFASSPNNTVSGDIETDIDYQGKWRLLFIKALPYVVSFVKASYTSS
ncbi:hypothetical protein L6164_016625 [Bauhinia variegata]|uniref:Uncharacterized protein n=1 Tax=Bauhinia variegata TaxID=167791 RepID=A0ACB9NQB4_BAUVA|nr:hypothetical protein L6164_016625 [Bauhinia variegata]